MKSIIESINELNTFSNFLRINPNNSKCETASIGVLNGFQVGLCVDLKCVKCVNLYKETMKILDVDFLYDKNLEIKTLATIWPK